MESIPTAKDGMCVWMGGGNITKLPFDSCRICDSIMVTENNETHNEMCCMQYMVDSGSISDFDLIPRFMHDQHAFMPMCTLTTCDDSSLIVQYCYQSTRLCSKHYA